MPGLSRTSVLCLFLSPALLGGCTKAVLDEGDAGDDFSIADTGDQNQPIGVCGGTPEPDPFQISSAAIDGDWLEIDVSYSGGCAEHEFTACWTESFLESDPVQAQVHVDHDAMGDSCEAAKQTTIRFDLTPMREAWQDGYQSQSGTIVINLDGQSVDYVF